MVFGWFSSLYKVVSWFWLVFIVLQGSFMFFFVGFHCFSRHWEHPKMYPSELHLGPTIQFRPGPSLIEYYKLNGLTKSQDIGYVEENHQPRWQLAVMGQIVRDGLTHGRCFRYRIAFVLKKKTIITFNNWLILAAIFQIFLFSRLSSCPPNMVELSMSKEKWLRFSCCKN